jgi:ubiquinone/menaquinone biosynthesis C-methylase UbiE
LSAIIRAARLYDLGIAALTMGRERRFRERLLAPVGLQPGEAVLDVGCGTGALALLAQQQVGHSFVAGIDASHEMITRARAKAARAGNRVHFELASADALPFSDHSFDAVVCTVTLHHLPRWMRAAALREMSRVAKTGGRVLLADFVFGRRRSIVGYLHRHMGLKPYELSVLTDDAGLQIEQEGPIGMWDLRFVLARRPQLDATALNGGAR